MHRRRYGPSRNCITRRRSTRHKCSLRSFRICAWSVSAAITERAKQARYFPAARPAIHRLLAPDDVVFSYQRFTGQ